MHQDAPGRWPSGHPVDERERERGRVAKAQADYAAKVGHVGAQSSVGTTYAEPQCDARQSGDDLLPPALSMTKLLRSTASLHDQVEHLRHTVRGLVVTLYGDPGDYTDAAGNKAPPKGAETPHRVVPRIHEIVDDTAESLGRLQDSIDVLLRLLTAG